jgi:large subunit ribosomal protein L24
MKIKVGDNVVVIAGKDKGKIGIVKEIFPTNNTLIIEGVNIRTIHVKPSQQNPTGSIEKVEKPINASNVMINIGDHKNPLKAKVSRIGLKITKNKNGKNEKKRFSKSNGEEI